MSNPIASIAGASGLVGMIYGFYRAFKEYKKSEKCPKCKWPMHNGGWVEVLKESRDCATNEYYHGMYVRVYECSKCGVEKHIEIEKPILVNGSKSYKSDIKKSSKAKHYSLYSNIKVLKGCVTTKEHNTLMEQAKNQVALANKSYNLYIQEH